MPQFWLMKSEPAEYGWDDLIEAGSAVWEGVRNHQAANNLRAMTLGDEALFYHSAIARPAAVGIMRVTEAAFGDPTDASGQWPAVRVEPVRPLGAAVTLRAMKGEGRLSDLAIIRQSRLSVAPVRAAEWKLIVQMAER